MCSLCGSGRFDAGAFGIADRPAQTLRGRFWQGADGEAAGGAAVAVLRDVQQRARGVLGPWGGPIVGISLDATPGGLRLFAGVGMDPTSPAPIDGFEPLGLPAQKFATAWHSEADGDVVSHYGRMLEWIGAVGHRRDAGPVRQREEYPLDADLDRPAELRLMIPIV